MEQSYPVSVSQVERACVVLNRRDLGPVLGPDQVYVGRPSKWGNPFSHKAGPLARFRVASREEAVRACEA